jgi:lipopolysaccharide transport system permease protein
MPGSLPLGAEPGISELIFPLSYSVRFLTGPFFWYVEHIRQLEGESPTQADAVQEFEGSEEFGGVGARRSNRICYTERSESWRVFHGAGKMWRGDYLYLIENLILKDFRIRYRNMSLGVLWSLLNPIVMMGVLTFVFTKVFINPIPHFPVFVLCGMIPYNFFTVAWITGTTSIVDNAGLVKRVPVPREIVPVASVLSNCVHLLVQIGLLLAMVVFFYGFNRQWFWLPVVWGLEIVFVCGLALLSSSINVYLRDTRYVVESVSMVLFWLVPIIYDFDRVPKQYDEIYDINPLAASVLSLRRILLHAQDPDGPTHTLWKLAAVSLTVFAAGLLLFHRMKPRFYEHI